MSRRCLNKNIKKAFGLAPRFIKSEALLRAMNIESIKDKITKIKIGFLTRLLSNGFNSQLLNEIIKVDKAAIYDKEPLLVIVLI